MDALTIYLSKLSVIFLQFWPWGALAPTAPPGYAYDTVVPYAKLRCAINVLCALRARPR